MSGHRNFQELREQFHASPEYADLVERRRAAQQVEIADAVQKLTALREERGVKQAEIAQAWDSTQGNVSRFEHTQDPYLLTVSRYVAALGGHLEVRAIFPDQAVDLLPGEATPPPAKRR
jgi:DNA-binding XRE family transcriptional regulator